MSIRDMQRTEPALPTNASSSTIAEGDLLKGDRALRLDHVRKLAERFQVSTALFVG